MRDVYLWFDRIFSDFIGMLPDRPVIILVDVRLDVLCTQTGVIQTGSATTSRWSNMKQIKELAADRDQKAQQLADLEAVAQVVFGMVKEGDAGGKSLLEHLREAPPAT